MTFFEILLNLAYTLLICAFIFRNILYLRLLTLFASMLIIAYFYFNFAHPIWLNIFWQFVLVIINVYQITVLLYEKYLIQFTPEEKILYQTVFFRFSPASFKKIMKKGIFISRKKGDVLINQGEHVQNIMVICEGTVNIEVDNKIVARCGPGDFIGEMSFISNRPATASVYTDTDVTYIQWTQEKLHQLLQKNQDIQSDFQLTFSHDLIKKLMESKT